MIPSLLRRDRCGAAAVPLLVLFLGACGGGGSSLQAPPDDPGFDFERSTYPGIVVVPLAAMQEGRPTADYDERSPAVGIEDHVRDAADTARDRPFMMDWDTILGLASSGRGDQRDVVRYYLAYEVVHDPTAGTCTVTLHVIEGLPFDPFRAPVRNFQATAAFGEQHRAGFTITTPGECRDEAAHRAGEAIAASGFFEEGWSVGPPDHLLN